MTRIPYSHRATTFTTTPVTTISLLIVSLCEGFSASTLPKAHDAPQLTTTSALLTQLCLIRSATTDTHYAHLSKNTSKMSTSAPITRVTAHRASKLSTAAPVGKSAVAVITRSQGPAISTMPASTAEAKTAAVTSSTPTRPSPTAMPTQNASLNSSSPPTSPPITKRKRTTVPDADDAESVSVPSCRLFIHTC
jgi:hypothetical protein